MKVGASSHIFHLYITLALFTSVSAHRNFLTSNNDIMDNQEPTSPTLNGGGHLPDGLFPHVLLRLREVKDENASLREDKAAKSNLIEKQQKSLIALETELTAFLTRHGALLTEHNALQTELTAHLTRHGALLTQHNAVLTEHNALQTRHGALQTEYIALLTRVRSLIRFVNIGMVIGAIVMYLKKAGLY